MTCGIYLLTFANGQKYVGQSRDIESRFKDHKSTFKAGKSSKQLVDAYNNYGIPILDILCECGLDELDLYEEMAIEIFDSVATGLNTISKSRGDGTRLRKSGENAPMCNTSNEKLKECFQLLVNTEYTLLEISNITGVSKNIIKDMAAGISHKWLQKEYPEDYSKLLDFKGKRNIGARAPNSKYSKEQLIDLVLYAYKHPELTLPEVADGTGIPISTVKSVCNGVNHKWIQESMPLEYTSVVSRKGTRDPGYRAPETSKYPEIVDPEGKTYSITNIAKFAREHGLNSGHLGAVLRGYEMQHRGWKLLNSQ